MCNPPTSLTLIIYLRVFMPVFCLQPSEEQTQSYSFFLLFTQTNSAEMMKKKFASDFLAKDGFVWINLCTKTLHWFKSPSIRLPIHPISDS